MAMQRIQATEIEHLASKSSAPLAISQPSPLSSEEAIDQLRRLGAPEWSIRVTMLAQDKRHDMAPHLLRYWAEKLKNVPDELICEALTTARWELFPSVDDVLRVVDEIRERRRVAQGDREWQKWKADQAQAAREGKLATEEDCAMLRRRLRELFGDPTIKTEHTEASGVRNGDAKLQPVDGASRVEAAAGGGDGGIPGDTAG